MMNWTAQMSRSLFLYRKFVGDVRIIFRRILKHHWCWNYVNASLFKDFSNRYQFCRLIYYFSRLIHKHTAYNKWLQVYLDERHFVDDFVLNHQSSNNLALLRSAWFTMVGMAQNRFVTNSNWLSDFCQISYIGSCHVHIKKAYMSLWMKALSITWPKLGLIFIWNKHDFCKRKMQYCEPYRTFSARFLDTT